MKNAVILQDINHFNIRQIVESGQIFRTKPICDTGYLLVAKEKLMKVTQQEESTSIVIHNTSASEVDQIWYEYFDIDTDYKTITDELSAKDEYMTKAVKFGKGIRILKQDPWEMLISFILSQNKTIPQIKQCIENISEKFGTPLEDQDSQETIYYAFPTPEQLIKATEEDLRACKVGFRAPYIKDACQKVFNEEVALNDIYTFSTELAKQELLKIKGVGSKIADCVLLFSYARTEVFPTDVWIKRVIEGLYFKGQETKLSEIQNFAKEYFGDLAGYAQQYLFYYGRENALFKNNPISKD